MILPHGTVLLNSKWTASEPRVANEDEGAGGVFGKVSSQVVLRLPLWNLPLCFHGVRIIDSGGKLISL